MASKWRPKTKKSYFRCQMAKNQRILKNLFAKISLKITFFQIFSGTTAANATIFGVNGLFLLLNI
jgi:hypothetical protein